MGAYVERHTDGRGFDRGFDTVAGENVARSVRATRLNGDLITVGAPAGGSLRRAYGSGLSAHFVSMLVPMIQGVGRERHGTILRQAADLVEGRHLRPLVDDRAFTFEEIGDAHTYAASGEAVGKVAVRHPDDG